MSSSSEVQLIIASNYLGVSAITLYLFDYCITFSRERKVIWSRKVSTASILYLLIRYPALTYHALFLYLNIDNKSCGLLWHVLQTLEVMIYTSITLVIGIRIYAITNRNSRIATVLLALNFMSTGANIFAAVANTLLWDKDVELESCSTALTYSQNLPLSLAISTYVSAAISDIVAVWVTYLRYNRCKSSLSRLFWADGVSDFIIFLFINLMELLSNLPAFPYLNAATPLLRVIPPITTYRFILKLRTWVPKEDLVSSEGDSGDLTSSDTTSTRSMIFAPSQHTEEGGAEDYHPQVGPYYPVQHDHVSTYGADDEEYGRPDFEGRFELEEMRRALNQSLAAHRHMTSNENVDECDENDFDGPLRLSEAQGCTPSQTEEFVDGNDIGAPDNV